LPGACDWPESSGGLRKEWEFPLRSWLVTLGLGNHWWKFPKLRFASSSPRVLVRGLHPRQGRWVLGCLWWVPLWFIRVLRLRAAWASSAGSKQHPTIPLLPHCWP
jgi:hypothetical protein